MSFKKGFPGWGSLFVVCGAQSPIGCGDPCRGAIHEAFGKTCGTMWASSLQRRIGTKSQPPKPPLCKGRWHSEAVTEGLIENTRLMIYGNPSVSLRLTAPFTQGSLYEGRENGRPMVSPRRRWVRKGGLRTNKLRCSRLQIWFRKMQSCETRD